jgi:hypothetical protein
VLVPLKILSDYWLVVHSNSSTIWSVSQFLNFFLVLCVSVVVWFTLWSLSCYMHMHIRPWCQYVAATCIE